MNDVFCIEKEEKRMGKLSKRLISMLIITLMICTVLPFHVLAADTEIETNQTESVSSVPDGGDSIGDSLEEDEAETDTPEEDESEEESEEEEEESSDEPELIVEEAWESEAAAVSADAEEDDKKDIVEVFLDDAAENKMILVDGSAEEVAGQQYQTVDAAAGFIKTQEDTDGWTITVMPGVYGDFTLDDSLTNVVLAGGERQTDESAEEESEEADAVVFNGCSSVSTSAEIHDVCFIAREDDAGDAMLKIDEEAAVVVDHCYFKAPNGTAIDAHSFSDLTVANSEFSDVGAYAVSCDPEKISPQDNTLTVTDNTAKACSFFLYGSFSNLTVTGNTITGSEKAWTATLLSYRGSGSQKVADNIFEYADFGYQNAVGYDISAKEYLETNRFEPGYAVDEFFDYSDTLQSEDSGSTATAFNEEEYADRDWYQHYETRYYAPEREGYHVVWSADPSDKEGCAEIKNYLSDGHSNENPLLAVRKDGEGPKFSMSLDPHGLTLEYEKSYGIKIFAYDQSDETIGLEGAQFELKQGDTVIAGQLTTDSKGYAVAEGLPAGTYTLTETKAPEDYAKSKGAIEVVVSADEADSDDYVTVCVANTLVPHTGGSGTRMFTIAGVLIIAAAVIGFILSRRKRNQ